MSGMTTLNARDEDSLATLRACFELGVNHLDTAYCYGAQGESERLIAQAIRGRRDELVIATKGGIHWENGTMCHDGSPETLQRECEESLQRLEIEVIDLYYLHSPDPKTPIAESAGAIARLIQQGKVRAAGLSNGNVAQLAEFAKECRLTAIQPPYNILQRGIEKEILPWCRERNVAVLVYWPLMKGLLTGKYPREHRFDPKDGRSKYPMFVGEEWEKNQDFLDALRAIAKDTDRTVAQVVINWTIHQPGVTAALCGAIRESQIRDNASGMGWRLSAEQLAKIDAALVRRGEPKAGRAV
jgi:aryl-alcohol dehydrogenase-like predicted oxidoreductase